MNSKPNKFAISIGGFMGTSYSLMLKDEVLLYQAARLVMESRPKNVLPIKRHHGCNLRGP